MSLCRFLYLLKTSAKGVCEIAFPIFDGNEPLAVLNVATQEGHALSGKDLILLDDLMELATNTIINAKKYSHMLKEKLTLERIYGPHQDLCAGDGAAHRGKKPGCP